MGAKEDNLSLYAEYNKTLRAWLVGFGFGVPALFIINEAAQKRLMAAPNAKAIIWLFLVGAAAQVIMALVNKIIAWCAYYHHDNANSNWVAGCIAAMENWFLIDVVLDVVSMLTFGWSIILIVNLFIA